jgi:phytoene dehydrogenase-like protein
MMPNNSVIIIGAGLAGLSTGCYAQMNGYNTQIFEMQNKPGGVCVSWKRGDYNFDYAVHNIFGVSTKPTGSLYNRLWDELGALRNTSVYGFNEFVQVEADGKALTVYSDPEKLEKHLKELSPTDAAVAEEFVSAVKKFRGHDVFSALFGGAGAKLKMLPLMGTLMKYAKTPLKEFSQKFTDPFLQKAFPTIQYDIQEVPVFIPIIFLSMLSVGDAGWPIGGSAALSKNIENSYLSLGGKVHYKSRVKKIIVKEGVAKGVQLEDGSEHFADLVVSAADGYSTIFGMLDGKYTAPLIDAYYKSYPKTQSFGLEVWYGVKRDFVNEPHAMVLFLDKPLNVEDTPRDKLDIEILNFDPTLAPQGKTVIKVNFDSNYDYWQNLSQNTAAYKQQKRQIADEVAERLEKRFPNFKSQIEAFDVVTPVSVEHWTGGFRGFAQPWPAPSDLAKDINKTGVSKTLPGLKNFYMVGQWAGGTFGISTVCMMGKGLVRDICKADGKKFQIKPIP